MFKRNLKELSLKTIILFFLVKLVFAKVNRKLLVLKGNLRDP